jgi:hypothetical protein
VQRQKADISALAYVWIVPEKLRFRVGEALGPNSCNSDPMPVRLRDPPWFYWTETGCPHYPYLPGFI